MLCDVPTNQSYSAWFAITAEMDNHDFLRYVQGWLAISQVTESAMSDRVTYRGQDNQSALLNLCKTGQGISLLENDGLINKVTAEALNRYCISIDRYFDTDLVNQSLLSKSASDTSVLPSYYLRCAANAG